MITIKDNISREDIFSKALCAQVKHWPDVQVQIGTLDEGWVTADSFFHDSAAISALLDHERSLNEDTDAKASAAFLMTDYCHIYTAATIPFLAGFTIIPDVSATNFALHFYMENHEHKGRIYELPRAHVRYLSADVFQTFSLEQLSQKFRQSTEGHFRPFIEILSWLTGLSSGALWRLLSDAIAARFLEAGRHFGCLERAKSLALHVLKEPGSPLNNKQTQYFDLTVLDGDRREVSHTFRARGGCCRFYSVKGGQYCTTCVLKDRHERDAQLKDNMRRHLGVARDTPA